jgi:carboxyl-terminal processing protease
MRLCAVSLLLFLTAGISCAQSSGNKCEHAGSLISQIEKNHIQPLPVNDEWSERVFTNLFDQLDPLHLFFTHDDLNAFIAQQHQLDNLVKENKHCAWVSTVSEHFKKRVSEYKLRLEQLFSKSFDYTVADQFDLAHFPPENFAASTQQLEAQRKAYLKFQILMRMYLESVADSSGKPLISYEDFARKNVRKKELQKLTDLELEGFESYTSQAFLKAIALAYDPHTIYMSFSEHEDFNEGLSDENLSFGFALSENETGSFVVTDIIPGGPAWNSNAIREGDIVLNAVLPDNRDLNSMDYEIEDFEELLSSATVTEARFTLKKTDGQLINIKLVKEKVRSIENTVSGYVLKGVKKIGYIPLPSFYFDTGDVSGGAAGDVAKAIIKLNKENIEGLILDLRFNGGGSIEEARELAGIFIDFGPVVMYKQADQTVSVLKDMTRGTVYNGPVIIMVNGFSASASELLAASLQDHKRAMIVGGRTYGKGTGQRIYPLTGSSTDFAKVTLLKIYRINGKTYQHKGVIPDITLPDVTQSLGDREADFAYALSSDSVTKKAYYTPLTMKALTPLAEKSMARVQQSQSFKSIDQMQRKLLTPVPLDAAGFKQYLTRSTPDLTENSQPLTVTNTAFDNSLLALDTFRKALHEKSVKEIRESFYIQEAYNIMLDYIDLKK